MNEEYMADRAGAIAVVGMTGRWPGAESPDALWRLLVERRESIRQLSDDELEFDVRKTSSHGAHRQVVNARAILEDVDQFDASFFNIYPKEAELMDPQHRLFLECAWETIEQAGYNPDTYPGLVGVFAGTNMSSYLLHNICSDRRVTEEFTGGGHLSMFQLAIGNDKDYMPTRVAYKLNLKGPAFGVQSACSTSLVAINQACVNLLTYQCDMALAGGVNITFPQKRNYFYEQDGMLSGDGHCRAFDAEATGTVFGSGIGVVALKRLDEALADGDQIRGIILGSAINNDGCDKIGYAAPSVNRQAEVIQMAQEIAGVAPDSISFVETHGTGTPLGDPIEIAALTKAFRAGTDRRQFCAIGSAKPNIGHTDVAAGVTGFIKTILSLEQERLPPILHYERPNPHIDFDASPFYPVKELTLWPKSNEPRRAGVSAFGVGGTNVHAVLEEAPEIAKGSSSREVKAIVLSARSDSALRDMRENLARCFSAHPGVDLADAAYTLQRGRKRFGHRLALTCRTREEAIDKLKNGDGRSVHSCRHESQGARVAFLFPGQGAQYPDMGREIYEKEPVFKDAVDRCAELLLPIMEQDIRRILYPEGEGDPIVKINQTVYTQPCVFIIEYALAQLWMSWGIKPSIVVGHSIGEYVAAVIAEVFSLRTALELLAERARLIQSLPSGSMVAVGLSESEVIPWLNDDLSVAAVNGLGVTVLSGTTAAVEELVARLEKEETYCKVLATSHGFHSSMMDPILDVFASFVDQHEFSEPRLEWISTLTGKPVSKEEIRASSYWSDQIRRPVRFADAVGVLLESPEIVVLEVGPGHVLGNMTLRNPAHAPEQAVVSSLSRAYEPGEDYDALMLALGAVWTAGVDIDWGAFYKDERRLRVRLPSYPFERKSFWVEPPAQGCSSAEHVEPAKAATEEAVAENPGEGSTAPVENMEGSFKGVEEELGGLIHELSGLDMGSMGSGVTFSEVGIDSLLAFQLLSEINGHYGVALPLSTMLKAQTIQELAKCVEDGASTSATTQGLVVEMTNDVKDKKLFLIHAAEGGILFYKDFAEELRSVCSVYGLEAPWLMSEEMVSGTMEDVASTYLDMIRTVQPEGPYMLAGYCYGGVVAFEMASQLLAAGESVKTLVLFDSASPLSIPVRYGALKRLKINLELIRNKPFVEKMAMISKRGLGKYRANMNDFKAMLRYRRGQITEGITGKESRDKKIADMRECHEKLYFEYKPRPYAGNMVLIEGMDREPMYEYPENLGWSPSVAGEIRDHKVQAEHLTMLQYPTARDVAKVVRKEMERSEKS